MSSHTLLSIFTTLLLVLALAACGGSATPQAADDIAPAADEPAADEAAASEDTHTEGDPLQITVSILPQQYFVERVGGEHVVVNVMVPPGEFPGTYEPKPEQVTALSAADAYVSIDVPFERGWLERFQQTNPDMRMVDTTQGIERRGDAERPDPHIWLSPRLVKEQARTIADTLIELDPDHAADYTANLEAFLADLDMLSNETAATLATLENRKFIVFHPAWGYFAQDYDLEMIPIEVGGQEPSAAELADVIERAREETIRVVFAQPQFNPDSAQRIAEEIGGEVVLIDPLAPDWLANQYRVADTFARVLGRTGEQQDQP
jgi:zinc transport system substrate-binding protein